MIRKIARALRNRVRLQLFKFRNRHKVRFECPICSYHGPFDDVKPPTGLRRHAKCPSCGSLERHRLLYVVIKQILDQRDVSGASLLHFAPEGCFQADFARWFGKYETADLFRKGVDHNVDIQKLPLPDAAYDFVIASHVLEHIPDDKRALQEIRRVLNTGGVAILPVPIVADKTVEYPAPDPNDGFHVRAPGPDYFDRYEHLFSRVDRFGSEAFPEKYQLYVYEDRTRWPNDLFPFRVPMAGERHRAIIPVCYV